MPSAEDQINMVRKIPPLSKEERKKKIRIALLLSVSSVMSVLFFVFAMLQKKEASKQKEFSEEIRIELEAARNEAAQAKQMAIEMQREAEKQRIVAEEALKNCNKSK